MKTIEEKARAYDEAIRKLRGMMPNWERLSYNGKTFLQDLIYIIPELAESEDEKVRKEIVNYFKFQTRDEPSRKEIHNKWIAWLEKQEGCEHIRKEWLEHIKQSWYKEGFIDGKYSGGTSKEWTINDAATLKELIDFLENGTAKLQHDLTRYANWLKIQFTPIEKQGEQKSADSYCQENCKGFQETGKCFADGMCKAKREAEQELTDLNEFINELSKQFPDVSFAKLSRIVVRVAKWAKSNDEEKSKVQPKQEWSEEDEQILQGIWDEILANKHDAEECEWKTYDKFLDWLKSLRPQNKWKPSDEQIKVCKEVYADILSAKGFDLGTVNGELNRLEEELKKLKK